jgi:hypothetical protein
MKINETKATLTVYKALSPELEHNCSVLLWTQEQASVPVQQDSQHMDHMEEEVVGPYI